MARSKAVVTREETVSDHLGGACGRGGRRPHTASYRKEKQNLETEVKAQKASTHACKGVVEDEGSHIAKHRERGLMIAQGGSQGEAFESSKDSLGNEEREECLSCGVVVPVVEATEGHEPHEAVEEVEVREVVEVGVVPDPRQMKKSKKKTRLLLYPVGQ
ncbi:hypothetical protein Syun_001156 [Stephania yunnanensis]|uniref:Uncharacterized protein n=1 Tax=Stephania yunnanensis TaxID=152371 RepID=A0AAP0QAL6_9MAGN